MKFSGKVWSARGTTWLHFWSIPRNRAMPRCATRAHGDGVCCALAPQLVRKFCLIIVFFSGVYSTKRRANRSLLITKAADADDARTGTHAFCSTTLQQLLLLLACWLLGTPMLASPLLGGDVRSVIFGRLASESRFCCWWRRLLTTSCLKSRVICIVVWWIHSRAQDEQSQIIGQYALLFCNKY